MRGSVRFAIIFVLIIAILGGGLFAAYQAFVRQALPKTRGTLKVAGLRAPVEVLRDEYGVAHIYASTSEDLFFAEGYVHAQERFWQMEFQRRTAAGRLSEIFGPATLETDIYLRHFDFYHLTEQSYAMLDAETRRIVDAYTAGVNAYIQKRAPRRLGLEFALLGLQGVKFEIEPWTAVDALIWAEMMIYDQSDKLRTELGNLDRLAAVGQARYAELHPPYRDDRPTIIPDGELLATPASRSSYSPAPAETALLLEVHAALNGALPAAPELAALGVGVIGGSNSFVAGGELTTSGSPLLANDPHMGVNMPALWYEVGMHCIEKTAACPYNFRGFSLPGVPGILIGHNERIAWGLTNAAFDAEDVFIERLNPDNPDQYEVNGEWVDMEIRTEAIQVRGQAEPEMVRIRRTRNGVVASDYMVARNLTRVAEDGPELYALSYAWTALEPVRSEQAVLTVLRAQNWDEFVDALQYFEAGKQNWLYADVDGNIGYVLPGKIPVRAGGDGTLPVPGWNDDYRWTGFIPYAELPRTFNPEQGFIATANNPQVRPDEYLYNLGMDQDRGQRAERITTLLSQDADGIALEDMIAAQTDNGSLSALEIIPYLAEIELDDPGAAAARERLLSWDAQMRFDSPEAALFNLFWVHLLAATFHDQLPQARWPNGNHESSDTIYWLLQEPENDWWDDVTSEGWRETRDQILAQAFAAAYQEGVEQFGADLDNWRWGELHTISFQNATLGRSGIALIETLFNRGPFPVHGSESVPQKTCWNAASDFEVTCIPALRQVIDLGDLDNARMIHSVGQSGHPFSPHYDDFIEPWRNLEYHPSNWSRAAVEAGKFDRLLLQP